jgi:hypothetical protein
MSIEVGTTEFAPETSSATDFDNHAGLRRATTDIEVGRRGSRRGGLATERELRDEGKA